MQFNNDVTFEVPINPTSFGQLGILILRECYENGLEPNIKLLGNEMQVEHENPNKKFFDWLISCQRKFNSNHKRTTPTLKLWHINQSMNFLSEKQSLLTFHEVDSLTPSEINILNQQDQIIVTCRETQKLFKEEIDKEVFYLDLPFDKYNFKEVEKKDVGDDRIVFNLVGKYEPLRKRHNKVIQSWLSEFGGNMKYELRLAITNHFYSSEEFNATLSQVIGKQYDNLLVLGWHTQNALYNDFLNHGDIVIGMGNESWGLPEFTSIGLGKHAVLLDCLGHKEWANEYNSVLIEPSGMIPADNDKFFMRGSEFNQGNFYDFNETDFIAGCYQAIERHQKNPINTAGKEIQDNFTTKRFFKNLQQIIL